MFRITANRFKNNCYASQNMVGAARLLLSRFCKREELATPIILVLKQLGLTVYTRPIGVISSGFISIENGDEATSLMLSSHLMCVDVACDYPHRREALAFLLAQYLFSYDARNQNTFYAISIPDADRQTQLSAFVVELLVPKAKVRALSRKYPHEPMEVFTRIVQAEFEVPREVARMRLRTM